MNAIATKAKYTPGPWKVQQTGSETYEVNSNPDGSERWGAVALCDANHMGSRLVSADEAEANARLIAAAPELLAVAESLFDDPCNCQGPPDATKVCRSCLAREAIAKATA